MATRVDRSYLRGFLVHDQRLTAWPEETTATQAGPRAGEAVPQARDDGSYPDLGLRAYGEQEADNTLTITVRQGGHVGDATISWADETLVTDAVGEDETRHRGWDNAVHPSVYEPATWTSANLYPHAATAPDGTIYVIAYRSTNETVRAWRRAPDDGSWLDTGPLYATDDAGGQDLYGTVAVDGSGAVWAWHWVVDTVSSVANMRCHVRRPGGNWQTVQQAALMDQISTDDYDLGRIRAAINSEGQVLMVGHLKPTDDSPAGDVLFQWAAEHPSAPLREVATDMAGRGYPDVVCKDGAFWVVYLVHEDDGKPILRVLGNAFESLESVDAVDIREGLVVQEARVDGTPEFLEAELAMVCAEDGTVYLYTNRYGGAAPDTVHGGVYRYRGTLSAPRGTQSNGWDLMGSGSAGTWTKNHPTADATEYPGNICATVQRGRVVLFANPRTTDTSTRGHLISFYMGGWTSAPRPSRYYSAYEPDRDPLEYAYVPLDVPSDHGWTETTTGTASEAVTGGKLVLSTTSGTQHYFIIEDDAGSRGYARAALGIASGGAVSAYQIGLRFSVTDGTDAYTATVQLALDGGTIQYRLVGTDLSVLGDDVDTGQAEDIEVLLYLKAEGDGGASVQSYWRVWSTSEDTLWHVGHDNVTTGTTGTIAAVRFGHTTSVTAESTWRYVLWSWEGGPVGMTGYQRPDDLPGAPLAATPRYVAAGVSVAATDGPAVTGDEFVIDPDAEYSLARLDPRQHPSPSETWRSTDESSAYIAYYLSTTLENTSLSSDLVGLYVANANVRDVYLQYTDDAGETWEELGHLNLREGRTLLPYVRHGDTIVPDPDAEYGSEPWFAAGELVGGTVELDGGDLRKVRWNSEGWWSVQTGRRRCVVELEGIEGTEAADGTCDIWSPRGLLLVHLAGLTMAGFRIAVPATESTVEGYRELGIALLGPVVTFARDFANGSQERLSALAELTTLANGYRQARSLNTPTRTLAFALSDLYDEAELLSGDGRYALGTDTSGALVLSNRGAEWSQLEGLLEYTEGPVTPCLYAPLIQVSDGGQDTQVVLAERHVLYGRLTSDLSRDHVGGTPEDGLVWRGADTLVIEEEK